MKKLTCLLFAACIINPVYATEKEKAAKIDAQFDQMFNSVDGDQDGKISRHEAELKAPAMADLFEQIDTDHDAALSKQEIKTFTTAMLKSREEFMHRLEAADKDKNGKLSRTESKTLPRLFDNFDEIDSDHDGQLVLKEISDYLRAQMEAQRAAPH